MPSASHTPPVRRLRPGAPVLRRDVGLLQVGLDHPARVLLDDTPGVRSLLAQLTTGCRQPDGAPDQVAAWRRLDEARLLVPDPVGPATAAGRAGAFVATAAWAGPGAGERLASRRDARVVLHGPPGLVEPVQRLALLGGVDVARGGGRGTAAPEADGAAALVVVLHDGEARREEHDAFMAAGRAHLPVWWRGGLPHLGPLVVPGTTACLRCVDAHEAEADPRRPLLVEQACRESALPRDPVLLALATAWVVRDVQRWAEGEVPTTWSATVRLGPGGPPLVTSWARHPHCGCAWDEARTA